MTEKATAPGASILKVAATASAAASIEWTTSSFTARPPRWCSRKLFFPADIPPFVTQIATFSTFAVGFITRPIGQWGGAALILRAHPWQLRFYSAPQHTDIRSREN